MRIFGARFGDLEGQPDHSRQGQGDDGGGGQTAVFVAKSLLAAALHTLVEKPSRTGIRRCFERQRAKPQVRLTPPETFQPPASTSSSLTGESRSNRRQATGGRTDPAGRAFRDAKER